MRKLIVLGLFLASAGVTYSQCGCSESKGYSTGIKLCDPVLISPEAILDETILETSATLGTLNGKKVFVVISKVRKGTPYSLVKSVYIDAASDQALNHLPLLDQKIVFEGNDTIILGWYEISDFHLKALKSADFAEISVVFEEKHSVIGEAVKDEDSGKLFSLASCLK